MCYAPAEAQSETSVDARLVNTQALKHMDRGDNFTSEQPRRPVRSVVPTGQTGRMQRTPRDLKPQAREGSRRSLEI